MKRRDFLKVAAITPVIPSVACFNNNEAAADPLTIQTMLGPGQKGQHVTIELTEEEIIRRLRLWDAFCVQITKSKGKCNLLFYMINREYRPGSFDLHIESIPTSKLFESNLELVEYPKEGTVLPLMKEV